MKKLIFLVFFMGPVIGMSQTDSVMYFFGKVLNEYRVQNGLNKVVIDYTLKNFSESHTNYMLENNFITHDNLFERVNKSFPNKWGTENVAAIQIIKDKPTKNKINDSEVLKLISDSDLEYLDNSLSFKIALRLFTVWKNSPGHNKVLLHPKSTKFYLSYKCKPVIHDKYKIYLWDTCFSEYFTM